MEKVYTEKAPAAIGPYSQAMKAGGLLFTSGQIPIDPATGAVAGEDITAQTEQVMQNLGAVLEAAGTSFQRTVKTLCFLQTMDDCVQRGLCPLFHGEARTQLRRRAHAPEGRPRRGRGDRGAVRHG